MNARFKTNLLEHAKAVGAWVEARGGRAFMDVATMALAVRLGERSVALAPQFVGPRPGDGHLAYFDALRPDVRGFVGWLPYPIQQWTLSTSKLAFKQLAASLGLRTPRHALDARDMTEPFLIKADNSSFGHGLRGPFRAAGREWTQGSSPPLPAVGRGEYAEAWLRGRIGRAWYWAGELAVLEVYAMPCVTGDGVSTLERLWRAELHPGDELPGSMDEIAAVQGLRRDDVVAAGRPVIADYRYVSPFNPTVYANSNVLRGVSDGTRPRASRAVRVAFEEAGRMIWPHVPGTAQQDLAFVLDAIVDDDDAIWLLEINSNAQLHPDLYPAMLGSLFPGGGA